MNQRTSVLVLFILQTKKLSQSVRDLGLIPGGLVP